MDLKLFTTLVYAWIGLGILIFFVLFFISAPYGRHTRKNWGSMISNKMGWIMMELPSLLTFSYFVITGEGEKNEFIWFFSALWILHYINRSLIFPFRIKSGNKPMPLLVALMAVFFNLFNGFFNGYFLGNFAGEFYSYNIYSVTFLVGVILFFTGVYINMSSDQTLMNLRKNSKNGYVIPMGGMFKYVSSPNYFGELIEWLGFAVMVGGLPAFSFFIWTFANLVPRAFDNHRWYKQKFLDYPSMRKAIIPYIL